MVLGITTTVFAAGDDMVKNEIIAGEVIIETTIENTIEQQGKESTAQMISIARITPIEITEQMAEEEIIEESIEAEIAESETLEVEATEVETLPEETIVEETVENKKETEAEKKAKYHTGVLTARKGYITDSPCGPNGNDGYETWYPTHPGGAVKILAKQCGFTDLKIEVCKEEGPRKGVRILSGTMPNGEHFENLVVVAADIKCEQNPTGIFERGQLIETSLGPGIIVDFCERAVNERMRNGRVHIDIATNW